MPRPSIPANDRLIVALDLKTIDRARSLVESLGDTVSFYKVNVILLLTQWGMGFVQEYLRKQKQFFVDLKMLDIDATIQGAVEQLEEGVRFLTLSPAANGPTYKAALAGRGGRTYPQTWPSRTCRAWTTRTSRSRRGRAPTRSTRMWTGGPTQHWQQAAMA